MNPDELKDLLELLKGILNGTVVADPGYVKTMSHPTPAQA
jgi:hypothetical protein